MVLACLLSIVLACKQTSNLRNVTSKEIPMAQTPPSTPILERDTTDRIQQLTEQVLEAGRRAGLSYLDAYDATARTVADYQERLAGASQVEWVASAVRAQADLTRQVSRVYTTTARELLK